MKPGKTPVKLNKEWHLKHKMPHHPTFEQKLKWHREHNRHCSCRPGYPEKLLLEMLKRGIRP